MSTETKPVEFQGLFKALRFVRNNQIKEAEEECTKLLNNNPLDQVIKYN